MYHSDEWTWDKDGNPEYLGPPREEPDCGLCNDGRTVRGGLLNRTIGRAWVPCPWCSPTVVIRLYQWLRLYHVRGAVWRLFHPRYRRAVVSDEAPF